MSVDYQSNVCLGSIKCLIDNFSPIKISIITHQTVRLDSIKCLIDTKDKLFTSKK